MFILITLIYCMVGIMLAFQNMYLALHLIWGNICFLFQKCNINWKIWNCSLNSRANIQSLRLATSGKAYVCMKQGGLIFRFILFLRENSLSLSSLDNFAILRSICYGASLSWRGLLLCIPFQFIQARSILYFLITRKQSLLSPYRGL